MDSEGLEAEKVVHELTDLVVSILVDVGDIGS